MTDNTNPIFIAAVCAYKLEATLTVEISPAYIVTAVTKAEAVGRAFELAHERWPVSAGWTGHGAVVEQLS